MYKMENFRTFMVNKDRVHNCFTMPGGILIDSRMLIEYIWEHKLKDGGVSSKYKIGIKQNDDGTTKVHMFDSDDMIYIGPKHANKIKNEWKLSEWIECDKAHVLAYILGHKYNIE